MKQLFIGLILMFLPIALQAADFSVSTDQNEYPVDEDIVVDWTVPVDEVGGGNWLAVFATDATNRQYRDWTYLSRTESGTVTLDESTPGTYEIRLFTNNQYTDKTTSDTFTIVAESEPEEPNNSDESDDSDQSNGSDDSDDSSNDEDDTANPPDDSDEPAIEYSLTVSTQNLEVGESVTVSWDTTAENVRSDWIGLYVVGASDRSYQRWFYVGNTTGSKTYTLNTADEYEFRYYQNNGYVRSAVSPAVQVTEEAEEDNSDDSDEQDDSDNTQDNSDDTNEQDDSDSNQDNTDDANDSESLSEYSLSVNDADIEVGDTITLTYTANASDNLSSDWIGLYRVGTANRSYTSWKYVGDATGSLNFTVRQEGTYEFRYFKNNGYTSVATSNTFTVSNTADPDDSEDNNDSDEPTEPDEPTTPPQTTTYSVASDRSEYRIGDTANAIWGAPSGTNKFFDWIGLYRIGTADNRYIDFEYTDFLSNREQFPLSDVGTFEFRYFKNNSYRRVAVSEPFTVSESGGVNLCNGYDLDSITNFPSQSGPVIALGDSITFGIGASPNEDYVEELEKRLNINIINEGVPSDTTEDVLARLNSDVLSRDPSTVIVFIGGNDELRRVYESLNDSAAERELADELDEFVRNRLGFEWDEVPLLTRTETFNNLETIVTRIHATGANTIVVGFDNTLFSNTIAANYSRIANETGSIYIPDIYENIFGRPSRMSDLVHPNNTGYDIVADRIQQGLECLVN